MSLGAVFLGGGVDNHHEAERPEPKSDFKSGDGAGPPDQDHQMPRDRTEVRCRDGGEARAGGQSTTHRSSRIARENVEKMCRYRGTLSLESLKRDRKSVV